LVGTIDKWFIRMKAIVVIHNLATSLGFSRPAKEYLTMNAHPSTRNSSIAGTYREGGGVRLISWFKQLQSLLPLFYGLPINTSKDIEIFGLNPCSNFHLLYSQHWMLCDEKTDAEPASDWSR
jgi:hypothetical protein